MDSFFFSTLYITLIVLTLTVTRMTSYLQSSILVRFVHHLHHPHHHHYLHLHHPHHLLHRQYQNSTTSFWAIILILLRIPSILAFNDGKTWHDFNISQGKFYYLKKATLFGNHTFHLQNLVAIFFTLQILFSSLPPLMLHTSPQNSSKHTEKKMNFFLFRFSSVPFTRPFLIHSSSCYHSLLFFEKVFSTKTTHFFYLNQIFKEKSV